LKPASRGPALRRHAFTECTPPFRHPFLGSGRSREYAADLCSRTLAWRAAPAPDVPVTATSGFDLGGALSGQGGGRWFVIPPGRTTRVAEELVQLSGVDGLLDLQPLDDLVHLGTPL